MPADWRPGAGAAALQARATLLRTVREFFFSRNVLEVTTPVLGAAGVTDPHIANLSVWHEGRQGFLQTSPEYAMKRLVAAGAGAIYQIGPAFRGGESGARHNTEFTLLEWYRPGFTLEDLAGETGDLLHAVFAAFAFDPVSPVTKDYGELFFEWLGVNPHIADLAELRTLAKTRLAPEMQEHITDFGDEGTRNDYLDLLFSAGVGPWLQDLCVVIDYPASQSALACLGENQRGETVAKRFEVFWRGAELANAYLELRDADELVARNQTNNRLRAARGLPLVEPDTALLAALPHLPPCSGVAVGLDRLLMLLTGANKLDDVIAFSDQRL